MRVIRDISGNKETEPETHHPLERQLGGVITLMVRDNIKLILIWPAVTVPTGDRTVKTLNNKYKLIKNVYSTVQLHFNTPCA